MVLINELIYSKYPYKFEWQYPHTYYINGTSFNSIINWAINNIGPTNNFKQLWDYNVRENGFTSVLTLNFKKKEHLVWCKMTWG